MRVPVKGFEGLYEITEDGHVFDVQNGEERHQHKGKQGYFTVELYKDRRFHTKGVHRLLAEAFIPNPDNLPVVNHKDENPSNNQLSNLEWCTVRYNNNYGMCNEKRRASAIKGAKERGECKPVICLSDGKRFFSIGEASRYYGITRAAVMKTCVNHGNKKRPLRFLSEYESGVL